MVADVVAQIEVGSASLSGATSFMLAVSLAVLVVSALVCWINSIVLALRAHSLVWLVIAIFLVPPFNAVALALMSPASGATGDPPR